MRPRRRSYFDRFQYTTIINLMTVGDIADKYGVTTATVSNWISRYESFPCPAIVNVSGTVALWTDVAITDWFNQTLLNNKKSRSKRKENNDTDTHQPA